MVPHYSYFACACGWTACDCSMLSSTAAHTYSYASTYPDPAVIPPPPRRGRPRDGWRERPVIGAPAAGEVVAQAPRRASFSVRHRSRQVRLYVGRPA
jgi:hypothetical protein